MKKNFILAVLFISSGVHAAVVCKHVESDSSYTYNVTEYINSTCNTEKPYTITASKLYDEIARRYLVCCTSRE